MARTQFDVCVIGAGLWGSAAARHLSRDSDLRVCLLGPEEPKKEDYLEAGVLGSHYDSGKIVREADRDPIWGTLAQRSIARYRQLEQSTGIQFYSEKGCLMVAPVGSDYTAGLKKNCTSQRLPFQMCGKQELKTFFPYLRHNPKKEYLFTPERSGYICPRSLVAAQKTAAHLHGCQIVNDIALEVMTAAPDELIRVTTKRSGHIFASRVLLCTGAFTNFHKILPEGMKLNILPLKETVMMEEVRGKELARLGRMPPMIFNSGALPDVEGCYILPPIKYPNGKFYMKIGHHKLFMQPFKSLEETREWFAAGGEERVGEYISKLLHNFVDFEASSVESSGCVSTKTTTGYPYCGMVSPNIGVLVGGNGQGAKSSDEIGRMGAKLIAKGKWDYDMPEEKFKPKLIPHRKSKL